MQTERQVEGRMKAVMGSGQRLNADDIDSLIVTTDYHVFPGTCLTVCCLTLTSGYAVIGESASISPETFDEEIGRQVSLRRAKDKIWELEGYLRRAWIANSSTTSTSAPATDPVAA